MRSKGTSLTTRSSLKCSECGVDMAGDKCPDLAGPHAWQSGPVVHCKGSDAVYHARWVGQDHHGHYLYFCQYCHVSLGCDKCAGRAVEVFCLHCEEYGLPDGLLAKGMVVKYKSAAVEALKLCRMVLEHRMTREGALKTMGKMFPRIKADMDELT